MTYDPYKQEREQIESDVADDQLERIVSLKEDLTRWLDSVGKYFEGERISIMSDNFRDWKYINEQEFDDLFHKEWMKYSAISPSCTRSKFIPSCAELRANMAREAMKYKLRPVPTNPATRASLEQP